MADEKPTQDVAPTSATDLPDEDAPPPAATLFTAEGDAWESAIDAWGASLPIATTEPAPPAQVPLAPAPGGPGLDDLLLLELAEDEAAAVAVAPAPSGPASAEPVIELHDSSGALVIPDLEELEAVSGVGPAPAGLIPAAGDPSPTASGRSGPWAAPESAVHFDRLPDLPDLLGGAPGVEPAAIEDLYEAEPADEPFAPLPAPTLAPEHALAPPEFLSALADVDPASVPVRDGELARDDVALLTEEAEAAWAAGDAAQSAACLVAAARRAREQGGSVGLELAVARCRTALERCPGHLPALRECFLVAQRTGHGADLRAALAALVQAAPPEEADAYAAMLREWSLTERGHEVTVEAPAVQQRGPEPLGDALGRAESALRRGDRNAAARALLATAERLGGDTGGAFAAMAGRYLEIDGRHDDAAAARELARRLAPNAPDVVWGALRAAARLPAPAALAELEEVTLALGPSALRASVGRWAARLARALGETKRARRLLVSTLAGEPVSTLTLEDRLLVAEPPRGPDDGAPTGADAEVGDELARGMWSTEDPAASTLSGPERAVLASAASRRLRLAGDDAAALGTLRAALLVEPSAVPLALEAEAIARATSTPALRASALALWADHDPARRAHAQLLRARRAAEELGNDSAAREALRAAYEADPEDPVFWEISWAELDEHRFAAAADALERGATAWTGPGAEPLVEALRERVAELRLAEVPARAVARALSISARADVIPDHPRNLALVLLERASEPSVVAAAFRSAAVSSHTPARRALEAAVWMAEAGERPAAAQLLLARAAQGELDDAMALLLARLVPGAGRDPALAKTILGRLEARAPSDEQRARLAFRRAEALEQSGALDDAAALYRELLAGTMRDDADVALRRLLWSVPDGRALDAFLRDEHDARQGVGQIDAAAEIAVERARVRAQLLDDEPGARELLAEAAQRTADALAPVSPAEREGPLQGTAGAIEAQLALLLAAVQGKDERAAVRHLAGLALTALPAAGRFGLELAHVATLLVDEGRAGAGASVPAFLERVEHRTPRAAWPLSLALRAARDAGTAENEAAHAETLARRFAGDAGEPRTAAALLVQAADAHARVPNDDASARLYQEALGLEPNHLVALSALARRALGRQAWAEAAERLTREAEVSVVPVHRCRALVAAATVVRDRLGEAARAEALLRRALEAEPGSDEVFARLRSLLEARGDANGLAELLAVRLKGARGRQEAIDLRLARVELMVGPLGDRPGAKAELRSILLDDPQHLGALGRLAALELEDGAYAVAAELYIRLARFERNPDELRQIFLRIGRIYHGRLADPKMATGAFERVLRLEPANREALEALSELYTKQADVRRAIAVTEQALELESNPSRRLSFLLRLAELQEKAGDGLRAGQLLRRAVEEHPRSLQAVGELARFYERTRETQNRNVLLDGALALLRDDARKNPADLHALRTLVPLLRWRQRNAGSSAIAQLLGALSDDAHEQREAAGWAAPPPKGRRLTPLANPDIDERAHPAGLPPGLRHALELVGPPMARAARPDLRRWGVGRPQRLEVGQGARAFIDPLAVDLGVRGFEVYVSSTAPRALAIEPGDPPALIIGAELAALGPAALRFIGGSSLRLLALHLDVLVAGGPAGCGALLTGIVRQAVPDFRHPDVDEPAAATATAAVGKVLSRGLRAELAPIAREIATAHELGALHAAALEAGHRIGLLACGDLVTSLRVLHLMAGGDAPFGAAEVRRLAGAAALVDFASSAEHEELASALELVS